MRPLRLVVSWLRLGPSALGELRPAVHLPTWARRRRRAEERALVAETEAFLEGDLAERLEASAGYVPAWAWTNRLAHASEGQLAAEQGAVLQTEAASRGKWRQARAYLAGEVLRAAALYGSLAELQRDVLVPLEIELSRKYGPRGCRLADWVATVEVALRQAVAGRPLRGRR